MEHKQYCLSFAFDLIFIRTGLVYKIVVSNGMVLCTLTKIAIKSENEDRIKTSQINFDGSFEWI